MVVVGLVGVGVVQEEVESMGLVNVRVMLEGVVGGEVVVGTGMGVEAGVVEAGVVEAGVVEAGVVEAGVEEEGVEEVGEVVAQVAGIWKQQWREMGSMRTATSSQAIGMTLLTCIHPRTIDQRFELVGSVEFGVL